MLSQCLRRPFMRNVLFSAAAAFTVLGVLWSAAQPAEAATEQVEVSDFYFCDSSFENGVCTTTNTAGDTVTWDFVQGLHTVTECDATYTTCSGGFDSGTLWRGPGGTFAFSQTFSTAGSYPYRCNFHPSEMRGVVLVVAAATDTPTPVPGTPTGSPGDDSPTATPAGVPKTGGEPRAGGLPLKLLILALGGALAVAGTGALYAAQRE